MIENHITDIYLEEARTWPGAMSLDEGLVLSDIFHDQITSSKPQRSNFILMALCQRGEVNYAMDTRMQTAKSGDLFFVSERHIVDTFQASPDFKCLSISLSTEFYHGFVLNVKNVSSLLLFSTENPVVSLTPREIQTFNSYYYAIREKIGGNHPYRIELVKALLLAMFYDMSGVIWRVQQEGSRSQTRADALFASFIRLLEANFRSERRVSWYAQQLQISPKYLSEVVKQVSKRTPNDWIDQYVILELRVLLKNSTKSIKDITEMLNFPNQSFLGKYFKEHMGVTPSVYRRK